MIEYLPLIWLYVVITAVVIYVIFPLISLTPKKAAQKLGLNQAQLIYLTGEIVIVTVIFYIIKEHGLTLRYLGFSGKLSLTTIERTDGGEKSCAKWAPS